MLDANLIFDGTLPPAAGAAITVSRASTNVLDMLANRDIGAGMAAPTGLHVKVTQAFTAGGAATLQIAYQTSPDNATFVDIMLSPIIPVASLVLGAPMFIYRVPQFQLNDTGTPNRYHRLNYTVATGPMTAGAVFAYLAAGMDQDSSNSVYTSGFSIDA